MTKLTDKEREQRRKKIQEEALESVAARGQFNFRLDGSDIKRLYELAGKRQKPVSAMVREWVLERLSVEEKGKYPAPAWAQQLEQRLANSEVLIALAALGSSQAPYSKETRAKIRDQILKHCSAATDDELSTII